MEGHRPLVRIQIPGEGLLSKCKNHCLHETLPRADSAIPHPRVGSKTTTTIIHQQSGRWGVSRWHFDSVPEGSAESSVGRHSWTVAAHLGDRGSVGLHIEEEGEEALNSSRIALDSHIVYGFPGYRILHKTSARFTKEVERYSIVCFFGAKPAIDGEINRLY